MFRSLFLILIIIILFIGSCGDDNSTVAPSPYPSVSIVSPDRVSTGYGFIDVEVAASDPDGIKFVELEILDVNFESIVDSTYPYTFKVDVQYIPQDTVVLMRALAVDSKNYAAYSDIIYCRIDTNLAIPIPPTLYDPYDITDSSVTITWSKCTKYGFNRYIVKIDTVLVEPPISDGVFISNINDTTLTINSLKDSVAYFLKVACKNNLGQTAISDSKEFTTLNKEISSIEIDTVFQVQDSLVINWSRSGDWDFDKYQLYISDDLIYDGSDSMICEIYDVNQIEYTFQFNDTGQYYFFVINYDKLNFSYVSNPYLYIDSSLFVFNYALKFDGTQYATIPYFPELDLNDTYTLEAWVFKGGSQGYSRVIDKSPQGMPYFQYSLICDAEIGSDFCNGDLFIRSNSNYIVKYSEWHHIALTYNNGIVKYYYDGDSVSTKEYSVTSSCTSNSTLNIGRRKLFNEFYYVGGIDEIRVWSIVRTSSEIRDNYKLPLSGTENGLVCYYDFDEGAGQIINSPVGNNGFLGESSAEELTDPDWILSEKPIIY